MKITLDNHEIQYYDAIIKGKPADQLTKGSAAKEDKGMTITKDVIRATVAEMKHTKSDEEIESYFKAALKAKSITIDNYCDAMKFIYA